jgi:hypothetical protein
MTDAKTVPVNSPEEKRMFDAAQQLVDAARSLVPTAPGYNPAKSQAHNLEASAVGLALQAVMLEGYAGERDADGVAMSSVGRGMALCHALGQAVGQFILGSEPGMRDISMMAVTKGLAETMANPSNDPFLRQPPPRKA